MLRLCLRDVIVNKYIWLVTLPFYLVYGAIFFRTNVGFLLIHVLFSLGLVIGMLAVEEMNGTDRLFCSLPLKRATIVAARYLSSFLIGLFVLALFLLYGSFLDSTMNGAALDFGPVKARSAAVSYLIFLTLAFSLYFPFYFRFGTAKGAFYFSAFIFCVVGPLVIPLGCDRDFWRAPGMALIPLIEHAFQSMSITLLLTLLLLFLTGIVFVSMSLSISFYQKREF